MACLRLGVHSTSNPKSEVSDWTSSVVLDLHPSQTHAGLSAAANYAEARAAESRADFIHKLRIVLKEPNESKS